MLYVYISCCNRVLMIFYKHIFAATQSSCCYQTDIILKFAIEISENATSRSAISKKNLIARLSNSLSISIDLSECITIIY